MAKVSRLSVLGILIAISTTLVSAGGGWAGENDCELHKGVKICRNPVSLECDEGDLFAYVDTHRGDGEMEKYKCTNCQDEFGRDQMSDDALTCIECAGGRSYTRTVDGYPDGWPRCATHGSPLMDAKYNCGLADCRG